MAIAYLGEKVVRENEYLSAMMSDSSETGQGRDSERYEGTEGLKKVCRWRRVKG